MRKCECHLHHSPKEILEPVLLSVCMLVCITHIHIYVCVRAPQARQITPLISSKLAATG